VAVGIMIAHHQQYGADMEMVSRYIHTNIGSIKVGNIIEKHNGK